MNHRITICTSCRHKSIECRPGYELVKHLRQAIAKAGKAVSEAFEISGVAHMASCDHPRTVAYHGTKKATYLFGDIGPEADIADLVTFAKQYAYMHDSWCSSVDSSGKLCKSALVRVPATIMATEEAEVRAS